MNLKGKELYEARPWLTARVGDWSILSTVPASRLGKNLPKATQCRSQKRKVTRKPRRMVCEEVAETGSALAAVRITGVH